MSPVFLNPAARTQMLAPAVIAVLLTVFLIGVSSLVISWVPLSIDEAQWRFQAAAQLLGTGPQIAFLLMMISLTAVYGGEYGVLRWTAIVTLLFAVIFIVVIPFFTLDFLTARHMQPQAGLARFTREGIRLAGTSGGLGLILLWAGRRGLMAAKRDPEMEKHVGHGLIVGQEEPKL